MPQSALNKRGVGVSEEIKSAFETMGKCCEWVANLGVRGKEVRKMVN